MAGGRDGLAGRAALVTGASRGIGAATARSLGGAGARVVLVGRDRDALLSVQRQIGEGGGHAAVAVADLRDPGQVQALPAEATRAFGPVELLVAFAGGLGAPAQVAELDPETWRASVDANLTSTFLTLRAFLPDMVAAGRGAVVTMASTAGRHPSAASPAYGAAKAGVLMLTRQAALQVAASGVRVNALAPGAVLTERLAGSMSAEQQAAAARAHPLGRMGTPQDVADAALFLLSSAASWITGATLDVSGGQVMT